MSLSETRKELKHITHDVNFIIGDSFYREENLKQTIQDFTEELKEKAVEIPDKEGIYNGDLAVNIEEIDKLNQKHYGDKLIHSQEVDVKDLKEDNNSLPDTICECGDDVISHWHFDFKGRKHILNCWKCKCKKFKPKEKLK